MKKFCGIIISILAIFTPVVLASPTFALENKSVTADSSSTGDYLCWSNNCSGYNYLLIEPSSDFAGFVSIAFNIDNSSATANFPYMGMSNSPVLFNVSNRSIISFRVSSSAGITSGSITFTMSEENPYASGIIPTGTIYITENGTFDVTNYVSASVDVEEPTPFIVNLFKNGFWGIMTAVATLIVPILALFLLFRLVHDILWGA
ncbi:hypothetical protein IJG29_03810 [Candidatus Saccharibacteria bacterium]|nr:hypothetical protein [Candidatus Saccharibacteria bacterium]